MFIIMYVQIRVFTSFYAQTLQTMSQGCMLFVKYLNVWIAEFMRRRSSKSHQVLPLLPLIEPQ